MTSHGRTISDAVSELKTAILGQQKHGFKVPGDFRRFAYLFCRYLSSFFRSFEILKFFVAYDL